MGRENALSYRNFAHLVGQGEFGRTRPAPHQAIAAGTIGALAVIIVAAFFLATIL